MNKQELVQEIAKAANFQQNFTEEVLTSILETITKAVSKGDKVTLIGFVETVL